MKRFITMLLFLLFLTLPAMAEAPYLQKVPRADELIFAGPSYDADCVGAVQEAGTYTIVEEVDDGEGNLWGRLKSGAGWIDLTHVRSAEVAAQPVSAVFVHQCPPTGAFHAFCAEQSEYTSWIVFRTTEPLADVRLVLVDVVTESSFTPVTVLQTLPELLPDVPLLAGVVFYGDMTTYGLLCTDANGQERLFTVHISGRNGLVFLDEWPFRPIILSTPNT